MLRSWSVSLTGLISATSSPSSKHATFGRCLGSNWHRDTNTQREIIGRALLTTRERVAPFLIVACRTFNTPQPIGKNQIAIRGLAVPRATQQRTTGRAKSRAFTMGARSGLIHLQKDCTPPSIAMSQPCAERRCVMVQILLAYRDQFPQSRRCNGTCGVMSRSRTWHPASQCRARPRLPSSRCGSLHLSLRYAVLLSLMPFLLGTACCHFL